MLKVSKKGYDVFFMNGDVRYMIDIWDRVLDSVLVMFLFFIEEVKNGF